MGGIYFMKIENLTEEELKDIILKKQLEWIKLCQDNFLVFAESVWQDFIYRKQQTLRNMGTTNLLLKHSKTLQMEMQRGSSLICHHVILNLNLHLTYFLLGILESIQRKKLCRFLTMLNYQQDSDLRFET